jgi:hypothetical protein
LVDQGSKTQRKNCLTLDFLPEKKVYNYTHKGLSSTREAYSNVRGKYLAHLIQAQEQFIIQNLFVHTDCAFGYTYDGFLFKAEERSEIVSVQYMARQFLDSHGFPELNFSIKIL